jgi:hypothetical protein
MYDYDRRTAASRLLAHADEYQRVMSSLTQDVVKKTVTLISSALRLADKALHGLKFNEDASVHDELEEVEKPLSSLARWMVSRREAEAEPVAKFAKLTAELAELTKFWTRPVFLNKAKHTEKVESIYQQMQRLKRDIMAAFRLSGAWKPASPAF